MMTLLSLGNCDRKICKWPTGKKRVANKSTTPPLLRLYGLQLAQHFVNLAQRFLGKYKENSKIILDLAQSLFQILSKMFKLVQRAKDLMGTLVYGKRLQRFELNSTQKWSCSAISSKRGCNNEMASIMIKLHGKVASGYVKALRS